MNGKASLIPRTGAHMTTLHEWSQVKPSTLVQVCAR